jgi:DNA gyrase subunit B
MNRKGAKSLSDTFPDPPKPKYTVEDLNTIKAIEAIRFRPAMYIGDMGQHGLHHLLFECLDNSIEEFLTGTCTSIECTIFKDGSISVDDDGPGIPLTPIPEENGQSFLEVVLTRIHFPSFDRVGRRKAMLGRFHNVGLVAVNALSEWLTAKVDAGGHAWSVSCVRGEVKDPLSRRGATNRRGTRIQFKPDAAIFNDAAFDYDRIHRRLLELSFLVSGVRLVLKDHRIGSDETFYYPEGLAAFVKHQNQEADALFSEVFTYEREYDGAKVAVAFQPVHAFESRVSSFVNTEPCNEGTHIKGFRAGLKQGLDRYGKEHGMFLTATPTIEHYYEGVSAVVSVWLDDPYFEGPTRFRLSNVEMATTVAEVVREGVETWAVERPDCIHQWIEKAVAAAEMDRNVNS